VVGSDWLGQGFVLLFFCVFGVSFFFPFFSSWRCIVRGCPPGVVSRVEGVGKWRMPAWGRFTRGGAG